MSATASLSLKEYLRLRQQEVDARLDALLPKADENPETLHRAMRHSIFAGGKRIRPILCLEAAAAAGPASPRASRISDALDVGCALEMIHTYSLIHDDLPALDNDDFRRGQPTCHKAFGEATAILAGDALLTLAFEVLADCGRPEIIVEVARAAGTINGMIGGQVLDLEYERRPADAAIVEAIHRSKTGAMLRAAVRCGALSAGASESDLAALSEYGRHIGLAFQIVDDILDVESSSENLGKTAGKDAAQQKATYPSVHGLERSRELAAATIQAATQVLEPLGARAGRLLEIAAYLGARTS